MKKQQHPSSRFSVGDRVTLRHGLARRSARVIEDQGVLGKHGHHYYVILVDRDEGLEPETTGALEEDLEPVSGPGVNGRGAK